MATLWLAVRRRGLLAAGGAALAAAGLLAILAIREEGRWRQEIIHPVAVIREDNVVLRKGNGWSYPPRYESPLNRGVEAQLLFAKGDWLQIRLSGGEVGWIPRSAALVDDS